MKNTHKMRIKINKRKIILTISLFFIFFPINRIYANPPIIKSVSPNYGYADSSNSFSITGKYFEVNCKVFLGLENPSEIDDDTDSDNIIKAPVEISFKKVTFLSSDKLKVKTPDNLKAGEYFIKVLNPSGGFNILKKGYKIIDKKSSPPAQPPDITLSAKPFSGNAPLKVEFTITGSDIDGSILNYEFDFEGDNTYDTTIYCNSDTYKISHTYTIPGGFSPKIRTIDNSGERGDAVTFISVLNNGSYENLGNVRVPARSGSTNQPPYLELTANPVSGKHPLEVKFIIKGEDVDGSILNYEWDFEGDGTYDRTTYCNLNIHEVINIYRNPGSYNAKVRVIDNDGARSETKISISVY
ncbi:MAG: PKD domain-containing protein [bacterium]